MRFVKEFALEARALANWEHFRYLYEKLGFSNGCLAVRIPSRINSPGWEREVLNACADELDRQRIEECFRSDGARRLSDPPRLRHARPGSWREYVVAVHKRRELSGAVSAADPTDLTAEPPVMRRDEVTEAFFDLRREWKEPYKPEILEDACRSLFRMSSRAMIIDPYFKPTFNSRLRTLERLTKAAREEQCEELVIVTDARWLEDSYSSAIPEATILQQLERVVLKPGVAVELVGVVPRPESDIEFHARYLLSQAGAIRFDKGFEATKRKNDIMLVDHKLHQELVQWYLRGLEKEFDVRYRYRWPKPAKTFRL